MKIYILVHLFQGIVSTVKAFKNKEEAEEFFKTEISDGVEYEEYVKHDEAYFHEKWAGSVIVVDNIPS